MDKNEEKENFQSFEAACAHYRRSGYTEEHDFPGEYRLLVNPTTMEKVRIYYFYGV
jgi:hypothetical protein